VGMLFRFLLIFLAVLIVYRAVKRLFLPAAKRGEVREGNREVVHRGEMVKDPVCGTFVPRDDSIGLQQDGEQHFFCSPACRDEYRRRGKGAS